MLKRLHYNCEILENINYLRDEVLFVLFYAYNREFRLSSANTDMVTLIFTIAYFILLNFPTSFTSPLFYSVQPQKKALNENAVTLACEFWDSSTVFIKFKSTAFHFKSRYFMRVSIVCE